MRFVEPTTTFEREEEDDDDYEEKDVDDGRSVIVAR